MDRYGRSTLAVMYFALASGPAPISPRSGALALKGVSVSEVLTNDELLSQLRLVVEEIRERAVNCRDVGDDVPEGAAEGFVLVGKVKAIWDGARWQDNWYRLDLELREQMTADVKAAARIVKPARERQPKRAAVRPSLAEIRLALVRAIEEDEHGRGVVWSSSVARVLAPDSRPLHSETVTVGVRLAKLAKAGEVVRFRPRNGGANVWALPGRSIDADVMSRLGLQERDGEAVAA